MRKIALAIIVFLLLLSCKKKNTTQQPPVTPPYTPPVYYWEFESAPVWADEFDVNGTPDANKWGYDVGGNGWGNNELQYYTNTGNAAIENGILKITAKKENYSGRDYTSARMVTRNKADWLYGRIEVKAKIPKGRGTWPAIWTLPTESAYGSWPKSGEIDLMEHVGFDPNRVHFTIHTEAFNHTLGTQKGSNKIIPSATDSFHVYRADWTPYGLRGYFDGEQVFEFLNQYSGSPYWPFDKKFHLILNIAVGGNWGGAQGIDNAVFPAVMEVDYVRAYKFVK
jgi:beta-glucanase (GH16 family)